MIPNLNNQQLNYINSLIMTHYHYASCQESVLVLLVWIDQIGVFRAQDVNYSEGLNWFEGLFRSNSRVQKVSWHNTEPIPSLHLWLMTQRVHSWHQLYLDQFAAIQLCCGGRLLLLVWFFWVLVPDDVHLSLSDRTLAWRRSSQPRLWSSNPNRTRRITPEPEPNAAAGEAMMHLHSEPSEPST